MKLFIGLILSVLAVQTFAIALPKFDREAEVRAVKPIKFNMKPKNDKVENFRAEIDRFFLRYQTFYDRSSAEMRRYRFVQVDLVTMLYNRMMTVFGDDIEAVRQSAYELLDLIEDRRGSIGANNACLQGIFDAHSANSMTVGATIQQCATFANTTMGGMLTNVFYPTFAEIQGLLSLVPNIVTDALSRGNVLEDEEEILEFLASRYQVMELEWITAVSQLLRWESARLEVDGLFLVDEMTICMANSVLDYLSTNARLEGEALACS